MTKKGWIIAVVSLVAVLAAFVIFEWHVWHPSDAPDSVAEQQNKGDSSSSSFTPSPAIAAGDPESDPAPRARVTGRVLEADGKPIADAAVCAWFERVGPARADVLPPACTVTTAQGVYQLEELHAGVGFKLGATAAGHTPGTYVSKSGDSRLVLGQAEQRAGIDLTLTAGGVALRGRVIDALGGPVAGAIIAVTFDEDRAGVPATSDTKGEFIAWVTPGLAFVKASSPGYAEASTSGYAPEHHFDMSLLPGSAIVGRAVTRPGGAPVAGAHIEAIAVDQGGRKSVTSQEDGTFRVEGLSPGRYHLEGVAPGLSGYAQAPVTVGLAETSREAIVELDKSPPVTALVRDSDSKAPCESGDVTLHDKRVGEYALGHIESDGTVHFVAVLPGKYDVDVSCNAHTSKEKYDQVIVTTAPIQGLVWEVDGGSSALGTVVDANGKPVANASVRADSGDNEKRPVHASAHTDAQGVFALRGLTDGKYTVVASAQSSGADATTEVIINGKRNASGVRLELGRAAKITGTVTDADGKPLGGVTVMVAGPTYSRTDTRDDGTFAAPGLTPGNYRLSVLAESQRLHQLGPSGEDTGEMTTVAIVSTEEVRKSLVVERRTGFLEGRVVDVRGEALPDFFIEAQRLGGRQGRGRRGGTSTSRVISDSTGHFRVDGLATGDYSVRAFRQSGAQGVVEKATTGATDLKIEVSAGGITGTVTGANGARPDRFTISVSGKNKGISRNETVFHASGAFALSELPPGTYDVSIECAEGTGTATAVVTDKSSTAISITLTPSTTTDEP